MRLCMRGCIGRNHYLVISPFAPAEPAEGVPPCEHYAPAILSGSLGLSASLGKLPPLFRENS
jgi:hypothetical protein